MNKPKHTKGPWDTVIRQDHKGTIGYVGPVENFKIIAEVICSNPEGSANARLIASAPELLEALEVALAFILEQPDLVGDDDFTVSTLRDAIAKAKGESK
jgi:hypothetical protein